MLPQRLTIIFDLDFDHGLALLWQDERGADQQPAEGGAYIEWTGGRGNEAG